MAASSGSTANFSRRRLVRVIAGPAVLLSVTALAACRQPSKPAEKGQVVLGKPTGPIRIGSRGGTDLEASAKAFTEKTGIKAETPEPIGPEPDYWFKVIVLHNAGTLPDVVWASTGGHRLLAAKGVLLNLSPIIAADKYDISDFIKAGLDSLSLDGKLYGMPWGGHPGNGGLAYNADMLRHAGSATVTEDAATLLDWTYDTLREAARRLTIRDQQQFGFRPGIDFLSLNNVVGAYGGEFFSPDGKKLTIDTPQFMAAMEWVASIWQEGLAGPWSPFNTTEQFAAAKLGMLQTGYWGQFTLRPEQSAFKWNCTIMPKGPAGKRGTSLTINGMCISSSTKQVAASWEFLKFLFDPEVHIPDVLAGRSRPALKRSILYHPRLLEGMKAQKVWADAILAAEPWKMPANYRWAEFDTAVREVLTPVWQGVKGLRDVMDDARQRLQYILDQPVPE